MRRQVSLGVHHKIESDDRNEEVMPFTGSFVQDEEKEALYVARTR